MKALLHRSGGTYNLRRSKYSTIFNYKTKKTNFLHTNLKQHHLVIKIFNKQSFQRKI